MKQKINLIIILSISILIGCNKDSIKKKCVENVLIIGNECNNLFVDKQDSIITTTTRGDTFEYYIDLNSDNIEDFKLNVYFDFSPCIYNSELSINSINSGAYILKNDSITSPAILDINDTIKYDLNWYKNKLVLYKYYSECDLGNGTENNFGIWYGINEKYIGLMLEMQNYLYYGWIKLSVTDKAQINLHEIAYKNSCF